MAAANDAAVRGPSLDTHIPVGGGGGRLSQIAWSGGDTPGPAHQRISGSGSGTCQRGLGSNMTGCQDSEEIYPFDTLVNPDDVPYPAPPRGSVGRIYDNPSKK